MTSVQRRVCVCVRACVRVRVCVCVCVGLLSDLQPCHVVEQFLCL
jgi:hypothetical protein